MYLVGLTGGIGSGKSTVAAKLEELGCDIVDADKVAREVVEPGEPALDELVERFGTGILRDDGELDRPALARIAFADDHARGELDRITHPYVAARIAETIARLAAEGEPDGPRIVVIDHPLLIETDQAARFDAVIVVLADADRRVARLRARGMDEKDVHRRMAVQADDDARRAVATYLIDNDGDEDALAVQVARVHERLVREATAAPGR